MDCTDSTSVKKEKRVSTSFLFTVDCKVSILSPTCTMSLSDIYTLSICADTFGEISTGGLTENIFAFIASWSGYLIKAAINRQAATKNNITVIPQLTIQPGGLPIVCCIAKIS